MGLGSLNLEVIANESAKTWLAAFTKQVDRLEKLAGKVGTTKAAAAVDEDEETETETEADEDFAPKKALKKAAASSFDDEDETEEEEEAPKAKAKTKAKALTEADVNEACKAYAKEHGVAETKALLKKKFKTMSIKELKPEQYAAAIALMTEE